MTGRAGRVLGAVVVAALTAALPGAVSAPVIGADVCPVPAGGHWTGSGFSNVFLAPFTFESNNSFSAGGVLTGSVSVNAGPFNPSNGTVVCDTLSFGTVAPASTFSGTLSADGRSATGTYTAPGDSGTWTATADPYVLTATSTVEPTTISPGGASSWVIDVENSGTAAATLVDAAFALSGSGTFGSLSASSVSQGTGCVLVSSVVHCSLGTILPGAKASANVIVDSTGGAGSSIVASGSASSTVGGGTDDSAPPVTISVVAPASLPTGSVSGIAKPGVKFETSGGKQATPTNPITVVFKLPKRVTAGTTALALSKAAKSGKARRSIEGVSLMSVSRNAATGKKAKALGTALGRPMIASVKGPSVPMSISESATEAGSFCGGQACSGDVIHLTSFSGYNDPRHPAKVTITWDKSKAGRGLGSVVFKRGDATTSPTQTLGTCVKTKAGYLNTPCITKKRLVSGGDVQFSLYVLSGDPKFGRR